MGLCVAQREQRVVYSTPALRLFWKHCMGLFKLWPYFEFSNCMFNNEQQHGCFTVKEHGTDWPPLVLVMPCLRLVLQVKSEIKGQCVRILWTIINTMWINSSFDTMIVSMIKNYIAEISNEVSMLTSLLQSKAPQLAVLTLTLPCSQAPSPNRYLHGKLS